MGLLGSGAPLQGRGADSSTRFRSAQRLALALLLAGAPVLPGGCSVIADGDSLADTGGTPNGGATGGAATGGQPGATTGGVSATGGDSARGGSDGGRSEGGTDSGGTTSGGSSGMSGGDSGNGGSGVEGGQGGGGSAEGGNGGDAGGQGGESSGEGGWVGTAGAGGAGDIDPEAVSALMRRVADYEIQRFGSGNDNGWVRAVFHTGMLAAYRALGDTKYRDYTEQWGEANAWQLHADRNGLRHADNQACVQGYAELYLENPIPEREMLLEAATTAYDEILAAPELGHLEWSWCDALFMAPPAWARVAKATGKPEYLALMHDMFWDTTAFLYDPVEGLFWRDEKYVGQNLYWSRGNGWVFAGIPRILEALPAGDARRPDYEDLFRQMAQSLRSRQADDGFWRSSLTQPDAFPMPETSGTAFFTFGMAWGIHHGVLERRSYFPTLAKGWAALASAVSVEGRLGWVQAVGEKPGPSTAANTNDYATGALLLAGSELLAL